jgi:hypothetical protein
LTGETASPEVNSLTGTISGLTLGGPPMLGHLRSDVVDFFQGYRTVINIERETAFGKVTSDRSAAGPEDTSSLRNLRNMSNSRFRTKSLPLALDHFIEQLLVTASSSPSMESTFSPVGGRIADKLIQLWTTSRKQNRL